MCRLGQPEVQFLHSILKCNHPYIPILLCTKFVDHLVVIFHTLILCHPALVIIVLGMLIRTCIRYAYFCHMVHLTACHKLTQKPSSLLNLHFSHDQLWFPWSLMVSLCGNTSSTLRQALVGCTARLDSLVSCSASSLWSWHSLLYRVWGGRGSLR